MQLEYAEMFHFVQSLLRGWRLTRQRNLAFSPLETLRLRHTPRVERLIFGMVVLYYALTLIGAEIQKRGLRRKVCQDKVSLAFLALRSLFMP